LAGEQSAQVFRKRFRKIGDKPFGIGLAHGSTRSAGIRKSGSQHVETRQRNAQPSPSCDVLHETEES
jgi:hypothetical protein